MKKRCPSLLLALGLTLTLFPFSVHADEAVQLAPKDTFAAQRLADRAVLMEDYSWYVLTDSGELRSYAVGEDGTVTDRLLFTEIRDFQVVWYEGNNYPWHRRLCDLFVLGKDGALGVYDISSTQPQWELVNYRALLEDVSSVDVRTIADKKVLICEKTNGQVWKVTRRQHYETVTFPVEETTWAAIEAEETHIPKRVELLEDGTLRYFTDGEWQEELFRGHFSGKDVAYIWEAGGTTFFLTKTGDLWGIGDNTYGQLGVRRYSLVLTLFGRSGGCFWEHPHKILDNVEEIFFDEAKGHVVHARTRDGLLWQWGFKTDEIWTWERNEDGEIIGLRENEGIPDAQILPRVAPGDMQDAVYMFDGSGPMVKKDGSLWSNVGRTGAELTGDLFTGESWYKWGAEELEGYVCIAAPGTLLGAAPPETLGSPTAYASTQSVLVDGSPVEFPCYALKDTKGNDTNYIKLRDVAAVLSGTAAQFNVGWDGAVNIETGRTYAPNGSEMTTPFSGDRPYTPASAPTNINGTTAALEAIVLTDDAGGAYTYYKLRDLGAALGFVVDWTAEKGIFIETK